MSGAESYPLQGGVAGRDQAGAALQRLRTRLRAALEHLWGGWPDSLSDHLPDFLLL